MTMKLATFLLACSFAVPAGAATLKPFTSLSSGVVRLSDLWDGVTEDKPLGPAPAPGGRITVASAQLAAIAKQFGVDWRPGSTAERAVLERAARTLTKEDIKPKLWEALVGSLKSLGAGVEGLGKWGVRGVVAAARWAWQGLKGVGSWAYDLLKAGILWGLVVCRLVWPISARRKFKEGLSVLYLQMGLIWKRGPLAILLRSHCTRSYLKTGEQQALQKYAARLEALRQSARSEFELRGPFPFEAAGRLMACTNRVLDAFYAMSLVTQRKGRLTSELGEPLPERGGRARRFYRVTSRAVALLRTSRRSYLRLWSGLESLLDRA